MTIGEMVLMALIGGKVPCETNRPPGGAATLAFSHCESSHPKLSHPGFSNLAS